jgi:hypothetical protein
MMNIMLLEVAKGPARAYSAADEDAVRKALRWLRGTLLHRDGAEPSDRDLLNECIRLVAKVDRAAPRVGHGSRIVSLDGYRVATIRSGMPDVVRSHDERAEAARQRMIDLAAGDDVEDAPVTRNEITAAEAIEKMFRGLLVGENRDRDWSLLFMLASKASGDKDGHQCEQTGSVRHAARKFGISPALVRKRRDVQLRALVTALEHLMPQPTFSTGVIWDDRKVA